MTGRELLAALQGHPEWLDMEVCMLTPDGDEGSFPLYAVDSDRFEPDESEVLVLSALECDRPEPNIPFPTSFVPPKPVYNMAGNYEMLGEV